MPHHRSWTRLSLLEHRDEPFAIVGLDCQEVEPECRSVGIGIGVQGEKQFSKVKSRDPTSATTEVAVCELTGNSKGCSLRDDSMQSGEHGSILYAIKVEFACPRRHIERRNQAPVKGVQCSFGVI